MDVRGPGDLAVDAIAGLKARLPNWIPRNGAPEVILLEALAEVVAGVVSGADVILGGVVESVLDRLYGVPRLPGAGASGTLLVSFDSPVTTTIPLGTRFLLQESGIELASTADVSVTGATSASVPVASPVSTSVPNGLGSDALVDVLDWVPNAVSVAISGVLSGGAEPEGDEGYVTRAANRLARVSSSLVVPGHFVAYVLEDGRASNAACVPAWDGVSIGTAGEDGGHVTVVTFGQGAVLSPTVRGELAEEMQAITAAGVTVHVVDASVTTVAVTATVKALDGWSATDVRTSVQAALRAHLDPTTWTWGDPVRTTTLIAVLAGADGVDYVGSLTAPAADVTIPVNGVAAAGTLTITVT